MGGTECCMGVCGMELGQRALWWGKGVEGRWRGRLYQPSSLGIAGPFPGPWRPVLGGRRLPRGWCLALAHA